MSIAFSFFFQFLLLHFLKCFSCLLRSYSVLSLYLLPASFLHCLLSTSLFHFPPSFLLFTLLSFFLVCFSPCPSPSLYFPWLTSVVQFCILVLLTLQPILPLSHNFIKAQTTAPTFSSSTLPSPFSPVCPSFLPSCLPFPHFSLPSSWFLPAAGALIALLGSLTRQPLSHLILVTIPLRS